MTTLTKGKVESAIDHTQGALKGLRFELLDEAQAQPMLSCSSRATRFAAQNAAVGRRTALTRAAASAWPSFVSRATSASAPA